MRIFYSNFFFGFALFFILENRSYGQSSSCPGRGTISYEVWKNVAGSSISDIPLNTQPGATGTFSKFEAPKDYSNNFGRRVRGYVCPPLSGKYTFWISSDEKSELWLSTSDSVAGKLLIAGVPGATNSREWNKYSLQKSAQIYLSAGKKYYIEALHKESIGRDNLAVAWMLPNGSKERPIPGNRLIPFEDTTSTPPAPGNIPFTLNTFAIIGDFGLSGPNEAAVANLVRSWNPEYIITVGDNNYPDGEASTIDANIGQYYHDFIHPYFGSYGASADTNRFFPCLGNHDWTASNAAAYFQYFTLPGNERYYDFIKGNIHFFCIDSDSHEPDGVSGTSTQATWLKTKVAASTSKWKMVYFHHSPYASDDAGNQVWMRWPFKSWGADIVFSGHSHIYERVISNSFPYIVVGTGGGPLSSFVSPVTGSVVRYNSSFGALQVKAGFDSLQFRFYNTGNVLIDEFFLSKTAAVAQSNCPGTGYILREKWVNFKKKCQSGNTS